jgi:5-dehydro-2-deoxygluconokinase
LVQIEVAVPEVDRTYDVLLMGRAGLDLYSQDIGAPFEEIRSFAAYVGGSPANVAVGASRLGLLVALSSAVGDDPVGDFILAFLARENVDTRFVARKPGYRSGAALLAIQPPDTFPLVYYRDRPADTQLSIDDVLLSPIGASRTLFIVGTNLNRDPSRSATLFAAWQARALGTQVVLDLDLRSDQWHDTRAFGAAIRSALPFVDVVLGNDDELNAAMLVDPAMLSVGRSQVSDARVEGDVDAAIAAVLAQGPQVVVRKRGAAGAQVVIRSDAGDPHTEDVDGFEVEVQNILGAGDAFAAGILYARSQNWEWKEAARFGNACGALVVARHGCSASMPLLTEAMALASGSRAPQP